MTKDVLANIGRLVEAHADHIAEIRHRLHRIPEPGFHEEKTASILTEELSGLGLKVKTGVAETGIIADLDTQRPGAYVAVRADMDGLPLKESTGAEYSSENDGYAHCCGHDGHAASVLGTALVMSQMRGRLFGKVRFIFQPAEEICRGARAMIENGVFRPDPPDAILGVHAWPSLPAGTVACRAGTVMASCDVLNIKVSGKGGHGARPELAKNPLRGMARAIESLSRLDNHERIVSLCTARVGVRANIIAGQGELSGTMRALNKQIREKTFKEIVAAVDGACEPLGLNGRVSLDAMSPAVIVDERLYRVFKQVGAELLGEDKVEELERPSMGSEDFGSYLEHVPGLLFRVGMGADCADLHQPEFDFNDDALRTAMMMLCGMAARVCREGLH
jgi:amidohydrolase